MTGGDWRLRAACRHVDPELAFAPSNTQEARDFAEDICGHCPVRFECLSWALRVEGPLALGGRHGIYGGLTPYERSGLLRRGTRVCADCPRIFVPVSRLHVRCRPCAKRHTDAKAVKNPGPVKQHGTKAGYEQHRRRGEPQCVECRAAKRADAAERRESRRAAA